MNSARLGRRAFLMQSAAAAAEWPEFRGRGDSLDRKGRPPLAWGAGRKVAWSAELPGYGQSSPVVWGKRVFVTAVEGAEKETLLVCCFDLASGRALWRKTFVATQRMKNSDTVSKGAPTPCTDGKRVYVFFESGDFMALDHDGNALWRRKLSEEYGLLEGNHGIGSSPRLSAKGVVVQVTHGGPGYLLCADRESGANVWKTDLEMKVAWTTPSVVRRGGKEAVIVSAGGRLDGFSGEGGERLWSVGQLKGNLLSSATVAEDLIVVGSSEKGQVVGMRMTEGEPKVAWTAENATSYFGSPLVLGDRIWMVGKVGVAWCLDRGTGRELWNARLQGECWASPLGVAGRVYFFTVKGVTEVYSADGAFERLAQNELPDMERTYGVACTGDGFLVRSGRRLVCVRG
jgi:outer membrane protein assembly factor BamB